QLLLVQGAPAGAVAVGPAEGDEEGGVGVDVEGLFLAGLIPGEVQREAAAAAAVEDGPGIPAGRELHEGARGEGATWGPERRPPRPGRPAPGPRGPAFEAPLAAVRDPPDLPGVRAFHRPRHVGRVAGLAGYQIDVGLPPLLHVDMYARLGDQFHRLPRVFVRV